MVHLLLEELPNAVARREDLADLVRVHEPKRGTRKAEQVAHLCKRARKRRVVVVGIDQDFGAEDGAADHRREDDVLGHAEEALAHLTADGVEQELFALRVREEVARPQGAHELVPHASERLPLAAARLYRKGQ